MKKNGWKTINKKELKTMKKMALDDLRTAYTKDTDCQDNPNSNGSVRV